MSFDITWEQVNSMPTNINEYIYMVKHDAAELQAQEIQQLWLLYLAMLNILR